mmetsp:Transcript_134568/g.237304  ORF Transcript_134568/g.237304 Transcript_134568/m.237304 type:complete len:203 (+) Transcript_134568:85-693(+)
MRTMRPDVRTSDLPSRSDTAFFTSLIVAVSAFTVTMTAFLSTACLICTSTMPICCGMSGVSVAAVSAVVAAWTFKIVKISLSKPATVGLFSCFLAASNIFHEESAVPPKLKATVVGLSASNSMSPVSEPILSGSLPCFSLTASNVFRKPLELIMFLDTARASLACSSVSSTPTALESHGLMPNHVPAGTFNKRSISWVSSIT